MTLDCFYWITAGDSVTNWPFVLKIRTEICIPWVPVYIYPQATWHSKMYLVTVQFNYYGFAKIQACFITSNYICAKYIDISHNALRSKSFNLNLYKMSSTRLKTALYLFFVIKCKTTAIPPHQKKMILLDVSCLKMHMFACLRFWCDMNLRNTVHVIKWCTWENLFLFYIRNYQMFCQQISKYLLEIRPKVFS